MNNSIDKFFKNFWIRRFFSNFNFLTFNLIISFIQTSILIILIGVDEYGIYQYILTFILISEVINCLDSIIERLYDSKIKSSIILNSVLYNKLLFYILFIPIIYFLFSKLNFNSTIFNSNILFFLIILYIIESFSVTFNYILISIGKVKILNTIIVIKNIILSLILFVLFFTEPSSKSTFEIFLFSNLILTIIVLILQIYFSEIKIRITKKFFKLKILLFVYNKNFVKISIPIFFTFVSGYFKNYFVSIFFGIRGEFENVTITRLILQMNAALYKVIVGSINRFLPEIKNNYNEINLKKIYSYNYFFIYISILPFTFIFIFIFLYFEYFLNYKINNEIFLFMSLVGISYLILCHAQQYLMILKLEIKYFFGYFGSPSNFIILPLAIYYLGSKYDLLGIGISYTISNIYMHLVLLILYIYATKHYKSLINLIHSILTLLIYITSVNLIVNIF